VRISVLAPAALYHQEVPWYSFLLETESNTRAVVRLEGLGTTKLISTRSVKKMILINLHSCKKFSFTLCSVLVILFLCGLYCVLLRNIERTL
jgi:hypothetical protein